MHFYRLAASAAVISFCLGALYPDRDWTPHVANRLHSTVSLSLAPSSDFEVFDRLSGSSHFVRQRTVEFRSRLEAPAFSCLSETQTTRPQDADSTCAGGAGSQKGWTPGFPASIELSQGDGEKKLYLWKIDSDGNVSSNPSLVTVVLDLTPPSLQFQKPIPEFVTGEKIEFEPLANDQTSGVLSISCEFDEGAPVDCKKAQSLDDTPEGPHVMKVKVQDRAGNIFSSVFPVFIDRTMPMVQVNSAPSTPTNQNKVEFTFTGFDGVGGSGIHSFECKTDGPTFAPCKSPLEFEDVKVGNHETVIRARDRAGNFSMGVSKSWVIDSVTSNLIIVEKPFAITNQKRATFTFKNEKGSRFTCNLDGGAIQNCGSPKEYTFINDGPHVFTLISKTPGGVTSTATYSWTVDSASPKVLLTSSPSDIWSSDQAKFKFKVSDTGTTSVEYLCQTDGTAFQNCSNPRILSGLAEGSHTFAVKVIDGAGNISNTVSYAWEVRTTIPLMVSVPLGGVSASGEFSNSKMKLAFDGDVETSWVSGAHPPGWIQIDLGKTITLDHLDLTVMQVPDGNATHEIFAGTSVDALNPIGSLKGITKNRSKLTFKTSALPLRYLKIHTSSSPSWVGWREIGVYERKPVRDVHWPDYFGYFASSWDGYDSTAAVQNHANMIWIRENEFSKLTHARSLGQTNVMIGVESVFFCTGWQADEGSCKSEYDIESAKTDNQTDPGLVLRSDFEKRWTEYLGDLTPFRSMFKAVYPVDEPFGRILTSTLSPDEKLNRLKHLMTALEEKVLPAIKDALPGIPVAVTFSGVELNRPEFSIPKGFDWVSWDCYGPWKNCQGREQSWYFNRLAENLQPWQKIFLVPDGNSYEKNRTPAEVDNSLLDRGEAYLAFALSDSRVVGVFPFLYHDLENDQGVPVLRGIQSFPITRARYVEIGKAIRSQR